MLLVGIYHELDVAILLYCVYQPNVAAARCRCQLSVVV
jgi:hypothetical protein